MAEARVTKARREQKIFLRRIEREWWEGIIVECEEASRSGKLEDMHEALGKLSRRG